MRKKILLCIILLIIIMPITIIIVMNKNKSVNLTNEENQTGNTYQVKYKVHTGKLVNTSDFMGQVTMSDEDNAIESIKLKNIQEKKYKLLVHVGDIIKKGENLYIYNNKSYTVPYPVKLVQENKTNDLTELHLLNYKKLYITTQVEFDILQKINYNSKVYVEFNGKKNDASIDYIDYKVNDGKVEMRVKCDDLFLPGLNVNVIIETGVNSSAKFINSDALVMNGEQYYATRLKGDDKEIVPVKVGKKFTYTEGDVSLDMTEIIDGLDIKDVIVVDKYKGTDVDLKKEFLNE